MDLCTSLFSGRSKPSAYNECVAGNGRFCQTSNSLGIYFPLQQVYVLLKGESHLKEKDVLSSAYVACVHSYKFQYECVFAIKELRAVGFCENSL